MLLEVLKIFWRFYWKVSARRLAETEKITFESGTGLELLRETTQALIAGLAWAPSLRRLWLPGRFDTLIGCGERVGGDARSRRRKSNGQWEGFR
eukprot:1262013-Rhodomonas_salina.1